MGTRGYVKEGLELAPMGSFDVEQGGVTWLIFKLGLQYMGGSLL